LCRVIDNAEFVGAIPQITEKWPLFSFHNSTLSGSHLTCKRTAPSKNHWANRLCNLSINFVALDNGAAGTDRGFQYSVTTPGSSRVLLNPANGKLEQ